MSIKTFEGEMVVDGAKFGIVISRFNSFIVESLLSGAVDTIMRHGGKGEVNLTQFTFYHRVQSQVGENRIQRLPGGAAPGN